MDYNSGIKILEDLRSTLEPKGGWDPPLRNDLARAYMNRGTAKRSVARHGPGAAIEDYDAAIKIEEDLRATLDPKCGWDLPLRNSLAMALMNRGNAKQLVAGHGPGVAIKDHDAAIEIMEDLRAALEPKGAWDPALRDDLAKAYANRGNAKLSAARYGPDAALEDYDRATKIMEDLRAALEPKGGWEPLSRNDLSKAYMNRGNAKRSAGGHDPGAAIKDYDEAIKIGEVLRASLESKGGWDPPFGNDLAMAYVNRGLCRRSLNDFDGACADGGQATEILVPLLEACGENSPPLWREMAGKAATLKAETCGATDRSQVAGVSGTSGENPVEGEAE